MTQTLAGKMLIFFIHICKISTFCNFYKYIIRDTNPQSCVLASVKVKALQLLKNRGSICIYFTGYPYHFNTTHITTSYI